jgi:medium-chain acyl-[acyl-carrier-protein] hydrolase
VVENAPRLHALPDRELVEELRKLRGTPEEVLQDGELRRLVFPTLRADFELCETYEYRPGPALDCPIVAFGGLRDETVSRDALEQWRQHTLARFEAHMFPGDHFFIQSCGPLVIESTARAMARIPGRTWT